MGMIAPGESRILSVRELYFLRSCGLWHDAMCEGLQLVRRKTGVVATRYKTSPEILSLSTRHGPIELHRGIARLMRANLERYWERVSSPGSFLTHPDMPV